MGYDHFLLEVAVSFMRFYPGNGLFEAAGVSGKEWASLPESVFIFHHQLFCSSSHVLLYIESIGKFH